MNSIEQDARIKKDLDEVKADVEFGIKALGLPETPVIIDLDFGNYGGLSINDGTWVAVPYAGLHGATEFELLYGSANYGSREEPPSYETTTVKNRAYRQETVEWLCLGPYRDKLAGALEDREAQKYAAVEDDNA